jgi:4-hydroxy-3-methylbut-2-en-1-yl diphosphate reductase
LIGERGHDEVIGVMGEAPDRVHVVSNCDEATTVQLVQPGPPAVISQTTWSVDDAQRIIDKLTLRFPELILPASEDICFATQNRQEAVKMISAKADLVIVLGSQNSSNSNRLREVAESEGTRTYLIDNATELDSEWLREINCVGITAGASTPEWLVEELINYLGSVAEVHVKLVGGKPENVVFGLPAQLPDRSQSFSIKP